MAETSETRKILTKPLPQILDEIVNANAVTNERLDQIEQIARSALELAKLLKLALSEGTSSINKRLLDELLPEDNVTSDV